MQLPLYQIIIFELDIDTYSIKTDASWIFALEEMVENLYTYTHTVHWVQLTA